MDNKIFVSLVAFAMDKGDIFVLTDNGHVTRKSLDSNLTSFTTIELFLRDGLGIIGRWAECSPKLIGVLDDIDRIDNGKRIIDLVYSLYMPAKNTTKGNYQWLNIKSIDGLDISEEDKNIIRYAVTV